MKSYEISPELRVDFRRYLSEDRARIVAVIDTVCAGSRWMRTDRFEPTPRWEHALDNPGCPDHLLLMGCTDNQPIGWCRFFPMESVSTLEVGIGLLEPYRDRGIGTRMLQQAQIWAIRHNVVKLTLTVHPDNHRAIHVFRKCDFHSVGGSDGKWMQMEHTVRHNAASSEHASER